MDNKEKKFITTGTDIYSEKNTRLFFIISSSVLSLIALFLLINIFEKTGILNSDSKEEPKPQNVQQMIQVEILNGCGIAGAGNALTDILRKKNIDVVKTGNYRSFNVDNTFIIDRTNNIETAFRVADSLYLNKRFIITEINKGLFIDMTIVIGKDFNKYFSISGS